MGYPGFFEVTTAINAPANVVWKSLVDPHLMLQWMGDPELELKVSTTWEVGQSIVIKGFHHAHFENKGIVLAFDPFKLLRYSRLSSLSRLKDTPENYSIIEFSLTPVEHQTLLTISVSNFPTTAIRKHLEFYWKNTGSVIKKVTEAH